MENNPFFSSVTASEEGASQMRKIDIFLIFQPTDILSSYPPADVLPSTSCRPSTNFCFPADVLLRFPPTDQFLRFPPTDDLLRTPLLLLEKMRKNRRLSEIFRYFRLPTTFQDLPLPTIFSGLSKGFP